MILRVWAPDAEAVALTLRGEDHPMAPAGGGWWASPEVPAAHGDRYGFRLDGGPPLPDPRSRWQPDGVHAPGAVYDQGRFHWGDARWTGRPLEGGVVYELHVGTFTPEGTLDAVAGRLDHLLDLGVTHLELMPLAAFDGPRGWGYDGVHLSAVHEPYGGPDALKRLVDRCHTAGVAVLLDVVHNHLGPSGNRLPDFGPYFTDRHHTPWGAAVNLDAPGSDEVRAWILDSALGWLRDFHLDGLRLDAVHALRDDRAVHLLEELAAETDALAAHLGRPLTLIAESDRNDPRLVTPRAAGGTGIAAQWCDDVHHAVHALVTGERQGYYCDFGSLRTLATALTGGFVHAGTYSTFRGRVHGRPVDPARMPGSRLVVFLQNHDQVGNRALGDRLSPALDPRLVRVAAGLVLTSPFTPQLFMGEEWGAATPWRYFSSFPDPELGRAVSEGRRGEFAAHGWSAEDVPDPQDPATFEASLLDWSEPAEGAHAAMLDWYRRLVALRRSESDLTDPRLDRTSATADDDARWIVVRRGRLRVVANLADTARVVPLGMPGLRVLLASGEGVLPDGDGDLALPACTLAVVGP